MVSDDFDILEAEQKLGFADICVIEAEADFDF
jgi:hypothetical protein